MQLIQFGATTELERQRELKSIEIEHKEIIFQLHYRPVVTLTQRCTNSVLVLFNIHLLFDFLFFF